MTRFETLDFVDLGGFVNLNLIMDEKKKANRYMYQVRIYAIYDSTDERANKTNF